VFVDDEVLDQQSSFHERNSGRASRRHSKVTVHRQRRSGVSVNNVMQNALIVIGQHQHLVRILLLFLLIKHKKKNNIVLILSTVIKNML
jgi:hypothetical protein